MNNKLAELRTKKSMTQKELAKALNTNDRTLGAWERGKRTPRPAQMQKIEDYFGVPKEEIFFEAFSYSK
ncbi:hypothetical protein FD12_GL001589 [Lentilactobacillus rapi DSM 19907 = JCM 15042]|uniref:HTH cro/C1-type domain-containing protein n=2 Tax=Lentilactobacillus rapi TaxID=481723 RepID=A0A512PLB5_9LACO|nr:helix-turn-helix transcriptional regulator [Lentilactobacillus rapi]KRL17660.1 hypothetical protein FD12_GL001589 [Lentilactobacillus rapi DSM 19907 = JCM 15042]GEP71980.1 hypothetical protein LRA02_08480 [Lentilactobacillus rapi]